jgi:hypothetical protein
MKVIVLTRGGLQGTLPSSHGSKPCRKAAVELAECHPQLQATASHSTEETVNHHGGKGWTGVSRPLLPDWGANCSLSVCCLTEEAVTRSTLIRLPPQELVGTFPRGEGKAHIILLSKNLCVSVCFWLAKNKKHTWLLAFPRGKVARPKGATDEGHPSQFHSFPSDR